MTTSQKNGWPTDIFGNIIYVPLHSPTLWEKIPNVLGFYRLDMIPRSKLQLTAEF